jgi:hypothetical protein
VGVGSYTFDEITVLIRAGAIITGVIFTLIIIAGIEVGSAGLHFNEPSSARWLHILSGIMWIGSIMLFNVWVLIWPNQQKILGLVPASDEQKAKAGKVALLASRTNFALSIPLVLCMGSATHGLPF